MVSVLEGRWVVEAEGEEDGFAVVSSAGAVSFVGDPDTELSFGVGSGDGSNFRLLSADGEELCSVIFETESQVLKLMGEDGCCETWRKTDPGATKTLSRKKGALKRIYTKEGQQGSEPSPPPAPAAAAPPTTAESLKALCSEKCGSQKEIDMEMLRDILHTGPHSFSEKEMSAVFQAVDKAGVGRVNFDELVDFAFASTAQSQ
eukprot:gb/GFBE01045598.1/.p1 GENE.gb/GFBE01045598.1/~~gb/GFBE01045598.1/.p1  ORF type:complete len:203 (+),score=42.07 gb/GFBE01045598.1/:1-609(+)